MLSDIFQGGPDLSCLRQVTPAFSHHRLQKGRKKNKEILSLVSKSSRAPAMHVLQENSKVRRRMTSISRCIARSTQLHRRSLASVTRTNMEDTTLERTSHTLHDDTSPKTHRAAGDPETNSLS